MPKLETAITLEAYMMYMEHGGINLDFLGKFQQKFGKGKSTAYGWEKDLHWKERAKQPVQEAVEELEEEEKLDAKELISGILDLCSVRVKDIATKTSYINAVFGTAFKRIPSDDNPEPENPIVVNSIEDMERLSNMQVRMIKAEIDLAKLTLVLVGEPDSHTEHSGSVNITQAIMNGSYYEES